VILQQSSYRLANLLHSDDTLALVRAQGDLLKELIIEVWNRGYRHLVIETITGDFYLLVAVGAIQGGNLVGDARRHARSGLEVVIKRSDEEFETPDDTSFVLPDGRRIEVRRLLIRSSNFTHLGLHNAKVLPKGYVRI
jgi:hypothetical protein